MIVKSADSRKGTNERKVRLRGSFTDLSTYAMRKKTVIGTFTRRARLKGSSIDVITYIVLKKNSIWYT